MGEHEREGLTDLNSQSLLSALNFEHDLFPISQRSLHRRTSQHPVQTEIIKEY